jgi:hypothetical protein
MLINTKKYEKTYPKGVTTMARAKKATAAAAEVKEVKEEVKAEVAAVEEAVEAPAKKSAAKKTAEKKPAAKKAAAKAEVKEEVKVEVKEEVKVEAKAEVFIEFGGVQVSVDEIIKNAKLTVGEDKDVKIYVKPDESKAYIVAGEESVAMDVYFC